MTLRELISSVDAAAYSSSELFQKLRAAVPEYGYRRTIEVSEREGRIVVTNVHIGSLGDIITYPIHVADHLHLTNTQLLDAILCEMTTHGYDESEQSDFWNDLTNLQKAKLLR